MRQETLAQKFQSGDKTGQASNVSIVRLVGGQTAIVGYGWAVYAVRFPSGQIHGFRGWHGYSPATSCQLTKMNLSHPSDNSVPTDHYDSIVDIWHGGRPSLSSFDISALDS